MGKTIRIGTRKSKLATFQAELVKQKLTELGVQAELVFINSKGDQVQDKTVQELGNFGVFTKALDDALFKDEIDLAVHSFKDVPTEIHDGLRVAAVLVRETPWDVLVFNKIDNLEKAEVSATIATGSPRRKAFWLNKYPHHQIVGIRGNVDSRLEKLEKRGWDGTILAMAGLKRLNVLDNLKYITLNWMIPAPAQGAIAVMCKRDDDRLSKKLEPLNDFNTALATRIERDFLKEINGGCSAPMAAYAEIVNGEVLFKGAVLSLDGKRKVEVELKEKIDAAVDLGKKASDKALNEVVTIMLKKK